jgi:hypothetical protein
MSKKKGAGKSAREKIAKMQNYLLVLAERVCNQLFQFLRHWDFLQASTLFIARRLLESTELDEALHLLFRQWYYAHDALCGESFCEVAT